MCFFFRSFLSTKIPISQCIHMHILTQTHTRSEKEWVRDECTELNGQPIIELTNVNIKHRRHPYEYNSVLCCYFFSVFFWIVFRYAIYFSFWSRCFSLIYVRISLESDVFFFSFSSPSPFSSFISVWLWCCSVQSVHIPWCMCIHCLKRNGHEPVCTGSLCELTIRSHAMLPPFFNNNFI